LQEHANKAAVALDKSKFQRSESVNWSSNNKLLCYWRVELPRERTNGRLTDDRPRQPDELTAMRRK